MTHSPILIAALGLLLLALPAAAADDPPADKQLEFLRAAVLSLEPEAADPKLKDALAVAAKPLIRYSDPTRGGSKEDGTNVLLDAGVWRLGTAGRPTALVTVELYESPTGAKVLAYEFLSLTPAKFALKHKTEKLRWDATGSSLALKDLPDATKPAASAAARLAQMRQLARRFGATEKYRGETVECRMLPQPIDRYHSDADKVTDGAIFALANGTNPEIGIVLEADADRWRYGILRLGAAAMTVTLDGKPVAEFDHFNSKGRTDGPYHNGAIRLEAGK